MEFSRISPHLNALLATLYVALIGSVNGQISTPCTTSMIGSFTPCLNYITGSSGTGSAPTKDCCNILKSLVSDSMDCACLIITGNVPFGLPFNRNIAISLPQACNVGVPVQCKATGAPLPAPGPVLFGPPPPPTASAPAAFAPLSPRASKAPTPTAAAPGTTPASSPVSLVAPTAK